MYIAYCIYYISMLNDGTPCIQVKQSPLKRIGSPATLQPRPSLSAVVCVPFHYAPLCCPLYISLDLDIYLSILCTSPYIHLPLLYIYSSILCKMFLPNILHVIEIDLQRYHHLHRTYFVGMHTEPHNNTWNITNDTFYLFLDHVYVHTCTNMFRVCGTMFTSCIHACLFTNRKHCRYWCVMQCTLSKCIFHKSQCSIHQPMLICIQNL